MRKPYSQSIPLNIGQVIASRDAIVVRTVLGSCVAVCMHYPLTKASAICHAIYSGNGPMGDTHYVHSCINAMVEFYRKERVPLSNIQVKLFGGASSIGSITRPVSMFKNHNVESALRTLEDYGFSVQALDTGGALTRELFFDFTTGDAFVRKFGNQDQSMTTAKGQD